MGNDLHLLHPRNFSVDLSDINDLYSSIANKELIPVLEAFKTNIVNITSLVSIPGFLRDIYSGYELAVKQYFATEYDDDHDPIKEISLIMDKQRKDKPTYYLDHSNTSLDDTINLIQGFQDGMRSLFLSVIVSSWTAFETVAADAWQIAFSSFADRISNHGIDVNVLLHGDVRKKFDFTSLPSMQAAYTIFKEPIAIPKELWKNKIIKHLNMNRHLVVHRAGIVDRKYLNDYKEVFGKVPDYIVINQPLSISSDLISDLTQMVILNGSQLIKAVDIWLTMHLSLKPND
jgi:hypothetical protein